MELTDNTWQLIGNVLTGFGAIFVFSLIWEYLAGAMIDWFRRFF